MDFSKYIEKGYSGLVNLGNTCFLNACIQALNHTYELHDCFHKHSVKKNIKENDDAEILKQWVELTDVMLKANSIISPNKFVHNVHRISMLKNKELFTGFTQNDMPEFLLFIIECFHNGISRETSIKIKIFTTLSNGALNEAATNLNVPISLALLESVFKLIISASFSNLVVCKF